MPATKTTEQFRAASFEAQSAGVDGRIPVVISSNAIVAVADGPEILMHTSDAVDMTRAPLPIIVTHKGGQINIGLVEDITLAHGVMRGMARFGLRDEAVQYAKDVVAGIIRAVSVGYVRIKGHVRSDGVLVTTRWMPTHTALVAEPADVNAGFYRAADLVAPFVPEADPDIVVRQESSQEPLASCANTTISPAAEAATQGEISMPQAVTTPAAEPTATRTADIKVTGPDPLAAERERAREIRAMGRQFQMSDAADKAIDDGVAVEAFRKLVTDKLVDSGKLRPAESAEIGMSERDVKQFSFCRALLAAADPVHAATLAPFELECSRAAQDKRGDSRDKTREAAVTIPIDVLARGIAIDGFSAIRAAQQLALRANRSYGEVYRDLVVGTPTAGGNLVATELLGSSFIELLRNAMVLDRLGITWLRDLNGNIAIPNQTGGATGYWVAESGAPTESQQVTGQVTFSPKTVGAFTDYSRRLLLQSSLDVEAFVRADLAAIIGQSIQTAGINGAGSSNEPLGLLNMSGIGSVAGGTNGAAPIYDNCVDLESAVAIANADVGNMAYLTNAKVRGKLRKTQEFSSTNGKAVWTSGRERGIGEVLGYDAVVTNAVPSNLVKGSSGAVCSAVMFGNWADLIVAMWGGLDVMLDPYTGATSGTKRVVALQDVDVNARRVASFAAMKDALTT